MWTLALVFAALLTLSLLALASALAMGNALLESHYLSDLDTPDPHTPQDEASASFGAQHDLGLAR
ncbi:hypothetical protein [Pseudomonas sp. ENNP23]|uniref:hypothetical protein n=1 Tax=Pseudomonas sp. ENNP23 TaxID=1535636 RepID=UPI00084A528B|nr:hypothetical protein [Pseudomonas sp. ENNP23]OEC52782.1 hypothetical protein A9G05_21660 [Pseudomonas sp. ENNP23]